MQKFKRGLKILRGYEYYLKNKDQLQSKECKKFIKNSLEGLEKEWEFTFMIVDRQNNRPEVVIYDPNGVLVYFGEKNNFLVLESILPYLQKELIALGMYENI